MQDPTGSGEPADPFELFEAKVRRTCAAMQESPQRAVEILLAQRGFALERVLRARENGADPAAIQRVTDAIERADRTTANAACGDGHLPPTLALQLEVAAVMASTMRLMLSTMAAPDE